MMTEFDRDQVDAVYKYLSNGFPELPIEHTLDEERMAPKFSVANADEKYNVIFIKKYWDRSDAGTLFKHLRNLDVANALRKNPKENIIVNQSINLGFEPK